MDDKESPDESHPLLPVAPGEVAGTVREQLETICRTEKSE